MSTQVWPPIPEDELVKELDASIARELEWLLSSLQETLQSLKAGLEECAALLAPNEQGSTLVLSSHRSEALKGFVTRVGTRIVKGDIKLRLPSLPPPRGCPAYTLTVSTKPESPTLVLHQLVSARTLINTALDVIDVSTWTGDANNAHFIRGQLKLLADNVFEARLALKGDSDGKSWTDETVEEDVFDPPLPPNTAITLSLSDGGLLLELRTIEPAPQSSTHPGGFSLSSRLVGALNLTQRPTHDEADQVFTYKGQEVKVREKVRVESFDPNLMAAMAKLSSLERNVALWRRGLDVLMGREGEEESVFGV